jgi:MFS family permease
MTPHLGLVLAANGILRVAGGASAVLVGVYVADLANRGAGFDAAVVGLLAAVSFGAELVGALPMGVVADAVAPRMVMAAGALLAALATALFGLSRETGVLFGSRALEGIAAAAGVPSLLAHVVDVTAGNPTLRARAMSYFELSLLAGLALGGLLGSQLWLRLGPRAFLALALVYVVAAGLLWAGAVGSRGHTARAALAGLGRSIHEPALRRLAPIWLCINTILGLWLGPTFYFLLTTRSAGGQFLPGLLAERPEELGWLLFAYSLVFGAGLVGWSRVLPRMQIRRALWISLVAMLGVSVGLLVLNHAASASPSVRWALTGVLSLLVMVESGFTPAALSLLAVAVGARPGRGAAMGVYSFLLGLGALAGSLLAGALGARFEIDGLIVGTLGLALTALALLPRLGSASDARTEAA